MIPKIIIMICFIIAVTAFIIGMKSHHELICIVITLLGIMIGIPFALIKSPSTINHDLPLDNKIIKIDYHNINVTHYTYIKNHYKSDIHQKQHSRKTLIREKHYYQHPIKDIPIIWYQILAD